MRVHKVFIDMKLPYASVIALQGYAINEGHDLVADAEKATLIVTNPVGFLALQPAEPQIILCLADRRWWDFCSLQAAILLKSGATYVRALNIQPAEVFKGILR